eukprot:CAMPEP_0181253074 /NCGR_PEP_ID=MMETSP1096-20121128/47822_1 /TAXON_ID=156174 ORGANISM="Chrysochromulina ericina, Strain CCMP281" /NCGR_SAMPLE_ID=MMETSP1096 /ASSEMBLY_ACC=CAM_ASM_000453 /LENGTH=111 /DNA_ID=CAMNT_0023350911 /DNA_START=580 /DNA_END=916 /DNA_ORIENTATION=+
MGRVTGSHRSAACTPRHIRTHLPQYGEGGGPTWRKSSGNDCTDARSNAEACSLSPQPAYTDGATANCNCPPTALQLAAGMACAQIPYSQDHSLDPTGRRRNHSEEHAEEHE